MKLYVIKRVLLTIATIVIVIGLSFITYTNPQSYQYSSEANSALITMLISINHTKCYGIFRSKDNLDILYPYKIDEGSEMGVFDNGDFTVLKIPHFNEIQAFYTKNKVPYFSHLKLIGFVNISQILLPVFIQEKLKILNQDSFHKYINKLDQMMFKKGFRILNNPFIQYRAYTNGEIIIDDISPDNLGLDSLGRIRIIDCSVINKSDWIKYYES